MVTLTRQEVFDKVHIHLLRQNVKSGEQGKKSGDSFRCKYRGPKGRKCAAGCLILDEFYDSGMEGCSVQRYEKGDAVQEALISSGVRKEDLGLVEALQMVHDTWEPEDWENMLKIKAEKYGVVWH